MSNFLNTRSKSFAYFYSVLALFFFTSALSAQNLLRFQYKQAKMGTNFQLIFYAQDSIKAQLAANAVFTKIDELNTILSDYLPNSELNRLSASAGTKKWVKVSDDLWKILLLSEEISKETKGNFDVTIGSLSKLWRKMIRQQEFIGKVKIKAAKKQVNYRWIKFDTKTQSVFLKRVGMRLDLGGIAKGYAVDEALEILRTLGVESALVDGGGDLRIGNPPPMEKAWKIQLQDTILQLSNTAIATSGSTYKYLEWNGKHYAHIINPKTGFGITNLYTISVQAENCALADAYASAFSVMKKRKWKAISSKRNLVVISKKVEKN